MTQDGDFLLFEGNRYDRRGFLYKSFVMSAIVSESASVIRDYNSHTLRPF